MFEGFLRHHHDDIHGMLLPTHIIKPLQIFQERKWLIRAHKGGFSIEEVKRFSSN